MKCSQKRFTELVKFMRTQLILSGFIQQYGKEKLEETATSLANHIVVQIFHMEL